MSITTSWTYAVAVAFECRTAADDALPLDIEERLDERERRILDRIERLRSTAVAGGGHVRCASDARSQLPPTRGRDC